jgi:hypothetical protein
MDVSIRPYVAKYVACSAQLSKFGTGGDDVGESLLTFGAMPDPGG